MTTRRKVRRKDVVSAQEVLQEIIGEPLTFAGALAAYREGEGLSQVELAEKLETSRQHICDFEKGRRLPAPETAWKIAESLGLSGPQFAELVIREQLAKAGVFVSVRLTPERSKNRVA